ncbi:MAG: GyrI-like domain-containing protein [Clostridiales bacterium]|nr:GyrI-like domain-containing protein [Clostridiales bacterium]
MNCKIIEKEAFYVLEKTSKHSTLGGANNASVPAFWEQCHSDGTVDKLIRGASDKTLMLGICYGSGSDETFDYSVAVLCDEKTTIPDGFKKTLIPARTWAVFECIGRIPQAIQQAWHDITTEFFPSSDYRPTGEFDIEVYPDGDTDSDDYKCEIWISVQKTATLDILDDTGLDERIGNTAKLIADFARENLDKELADEIVSDLAGMIDKKDD